MGRFASTAAVYQRARQPYGPAFFARVSQELGFGRGDRLLDLGTGPGLLALGFAPSVGEVWGVDPEPAMLDAARRNAEQAGIPLRLWQGTAETLPHEIGRFDIVTIGRALHWMDPVPTRAAFDRVVQPGGAVLVCSAASADDGRNPWLAAYDAVRARWASDPGRARFSERDAYFRDSRFQPAGVIAVETRQVVTPDALADRVLSMSSTSPEQLGGDAAAMRDALTAALTPFVEAGGIEETIVAKAEVFRSPGGRRA